jgi:two-component system chemotaxis response regulator CheB
LFNSAVPFGKSLVAVIMTGMGNDGAAGMLQIKKAGGYVIAESELTSVVYGMPKAVVDLGIADEVLPVDEIANAIVSAIKRNQ